MRSGICMALLCMGVAASLPARAADDLPGAKDHPLLTRYPDSRITEYSNTYDLVEYKVAAEGAEPSMEPVEGQTTALRYFYNDAETQPSPLQLIRNYQNAVKAIGGEVVYERGPADGDGGETTLKVTTEGKTF
jgi:OOP family OmpA-OmpF porin